MILFKVVEMIFIAGFEMEKHPLSVGIEIYCHYMGLSVIGPLKN